MRHPSRRMIRTGVNKINCSPWCHQCHAPPATGRDNVRGLPKGSPRMLCLGTIPFHLFHPLHSFHPSHFLRSLHTPSLPLAYSFATLIVAKESGKCGVPAGFLQGRDRNVRDVSYFFTTHTINPPTPRYFYSKFKLTGVIILKS